MFKKLLIAIAMLIISISVIACNRLPNKNSNSNIENSDAKIDIVTENEPIIVDEQLIEDIILNFGAEETLDNSNNIVIKPRVVSLYYYNENLTNENISPSDYFSWQHSYVQSLAKNQNWEEFSKKYASHYGENTGYFYNQDEYEANVQKFFDVETKILRYDLAYYHPKEQGYWIDGGAGIGDTPVITVNGYRQDGDYLDISLTLKNQSEGEKHKILTVKLQKEGYKYLSYINGNLQEKHIEINDDGVLQKLLDIGYSQEMCNFIKEYRSNFNFDIAIGEFDSELQKEYDREISVVNNWLKLSKDELSALAYNIAANSNDGKKTVFVMFDEKAYLSPAYFIWHNEETKENRLLSCKGYENNSCLNTDKNILLIYHHNNLQAFDLNNGVEVKTNVPKFDFGRYLNYQPEKVIVGIGYDKTLQKYVVAYEDWLTGDDKNNKVEVKLSVFDIDGNKLFDMPTGIFIPIQIKNFWLYSEKITFPEADMVNISFHDYGTIKCNYTDKDFVGTALTENEILTLWDSFEGLWQSSKNVCIFAKKDKTAYITFGNMEQEVISANKLSDNKYKIVAKIENQERIFFINTGIPRDNKISVMAEGFQYDEYEYIS